MLLGALSKPPKGVATLEERAGLNGDSPGQRMLSRPHRLKLLYSGRFGRGSGPGILSLMVSARLGSLRISCSQGEW